MADTSYEAALTALDGLITGTKRGDGEKWADPLEAMQGFLERLDLKHDMSKLNIVHIAGTKGKGSTCAMVESMLRHAGYRTGLFTSPHLVDVRERIRINGRPIEKDLFLHHFWWTHGRLAEQRAEKHRMAAYFRFLTLLAFRVFIKEQVEVAIVEVGLGGRLDSTNCIRRPVVCGISALGFDHMKVLGHTLPEIAREKAGIFKPRVPAFTVSQPPDAMAALQDVARAMDVELQQVPPLLQSFSRDAAQLELRLGGEHQLQNASLAVALAASWEAGAGIFLPAHQGMAAARLQQLQSGHLPAVYLGGLRSCEWPGRSQVVVDPDLNEERKLTYFLDGAHTPESMVTCAHWFSDTSKSRLQSFRCPAASGNNGFALTADRSEVQRILIFNCTEEREPPSLLRPLFATLQLRKALPDHALFVTPDSSYCTVKAATVGVRDTSWQQNLANCWRTQASQDGPHRSNKPASLGSNLATFSGQDTQRGAAVPSLTEALKWIRKCARQQPQRRVQVLVTGSLYIVGDMLRHLGHAPA